MEEFRKLLLRLSENGWLPIFTLLGIDPNSPTLRQDLLTEVSLSQIELSQVPGFGDLTPAARKSIEPGVPSHSILFHALASPDLVTTPDGTQLQIFPTAAELDIAENMVFRIMPRTILSITSNLQNLSNLAIVIFAREYRQSSKSHHGKHADLVFSRTGITRVGSLAALWDGKTRSYLPRIEADSPFDIRVLPARYGVYLAVQTRGDNTDFGPFKFNRRFNIDPGSDDPLDSELDFWVPVHKLFSGSDCLLGHSLNVSLDAHHVNEKLRRIHNANMGAPTIGFDSGFKPPQTQAVPFLCTDDLAEFLDTVQHGQGTLAPVERPRLIEPTQIDGNLIGTRVPSDERNGLAPSFTIRATQRLAHSAPEWMHVRSWLRADGTVEDLNLKQNVKQVVQEARIGNTDNYTAAHYSDFVADGWINAKVEGLLSNVYRMVPAYSLISAPDFFPYVDQSELVDWWQMQVPTQYRENIWAVPPLTLADQRSAANINLREHGADIRPENKTPTAIVGMKGSSAGEAAIGTTSIVSRVSSLPDTAAGIFAPGWDVSTDVTFDSTLGEDVLHLASYGLGSPFPEDAKLCAALSAFWPGVAPDTARSSGRRIVAPLTDREVGLEDAPAWDGVLGPRRVRVGNSDFIETDNFDHVDYVTNALENRFTMVETMKVSQQQYQLRIIATARMYRFIGDLTQAGPNLRPIYDAFRLISFHQGRDGDEEIKSAENALLVQFDQMVCRFDMVQIGVTEPLRNDDANRARWLKRESIRVDLQIIVDAQDRIVFRINNDDWILHDPAT